jgi:metal-responsive CopG/Arc/MetJ family transcriptional regulator
MRDHIDMRVAVSIPDEILERADRLAKDMKKSRSRLVSDVVREYLARHCSEEDQSVAEASRRVLVRSEW